MLKAVCFDKSIFNFDFFALSAIKIQRKMPSMGNVSIGLGQENDIIRLFQEGLW